MDRKDSIVFTPARIIGLEIKNRLVRSATTERIATERGEVSDATADVYRTLARGGVGLIVTGAAMVHTASLVHGFLRVDDDSFIPGLARIPRAVREADRDCKVMLQLLHVGRQVPSLPKMLPLLPPAFLAWVRKNPEIMAQASQPHEMPEPVAPSALYDALFDRTPRALTLDEIDEIIEAFVSAIGRATEAGFDGVQLHAAHGYLLSTFLSPRTNGREDDYGGSAENRTRIVMEICTRARKRVGETFPILIKMNTTDFLPDGMDTDGAAATGNLLSRAGLAAIETSGGMWECLTRTKEELGWVPVFLPESRTGIKLREQEGYFLPGALAVKNQAEAAVILVGGLRSFSRIEEILASGSVDFAALSRPLIRQPNLPLLWRSGKGPDKAECISCNGCFPPGIGGFGCRAKAE